VQANIFSFPPISGGESEKPLVIHVGRFGREKNLDFLKRLAFRCTKYIIIC
jgi:hypothetical protein